MSARCATRSRVSRPGSSGPKPRRAWRSTSRGERSPTGTGAAHSWRSDRRSPAPTPSILVRDFGLTTFEVLFRSLGIPIIILIGLLGIFLTLAPAFT